jgi:hypothetical protein
VSALPEMIPVFQRLRSQSSSACSRWFLPSFMVHREFTKLL